VGVLPFPPSSFPPRVARFDSYVQARLTVLLHKHAKVRADLAELCKYLCVAPVEVMDPALDAAVGAALASSGVAAEQLEGKRIDLTVAGLAPLGEIVGPASASPSHGAGAGTAGTQPVVHLRYPWQRSVRTLHTFLQEFSVALQDHLVATRTSRQQKPVIDK
jgi:hypothetical protein